MIMIGHLKGIKACHKQRPEAIIALEDNGLQVFFLCGWRRKSGRYQSVRSR
jgi:hypothetical protein